METLENEIYIYRNYLFPLRDLHDFEIADDNPDVRGWSILGNDGEKFGKVHELIVDIRAKKVRYLDVDIKRDLFKQDHNNHDDYHILIPIGVAILNTDDKNVIIPPLDIEKLKRYPFYRMEPIYVLRDYERSVRDFYAGEDSSSRRYDPQFYDNDYYRDDKFFRY